MRQLIPDDAFDGGRKNYLELIGDPAENAKLVARMKAKIGAWWREDDAYAVLASSQHDKSLNGLNIIEATKRVRGAFIGRSSRSHTGN
jgi:hypothetical protein